MSWSGRLAAGRLTLDDVERLAVRLAQFHAAARCDEETVQFGEVRLKLSDMRSLRAASYRPQGRMPPPVPSSAPPPPAFRPAALR